MDFLKKPVNAKAAIIFLCIGVIVFLFLVLNCQDEGIFVSCPRFSDIIPFKISGPEKPFEPTLVKKFSSEEDFKNYLAEVESVSYGGIGIIGMERGGDEVMAFEGATKGAPLPFSSPSISAERVSQTNVQTPGIDEPDIVKTDGKEIYFSPGSTPAIWRGITVPESGIISDETEGILPRYPYPYYRNNVDIIKAFPPVDLKLDAKIADLGGDLLLAGNILVIFSGQNVYGYDVSNPVSPQKEWEAKLENNTSIVGSRLYRGKIYLVSRQNINQVKPCPILPLTFGGTMLEIKCPDIYHPTSPAPVDIIFTAMILDPSTGKVENPVSFVGSSGSSIIYMSEKAVYITYSYYESFIKFFFNFLKEKGRGIAPEWLIDKIGKLETYDIGFDAKMVEFQSIWQKYLNSLDDDERLRVENEFTNRGSDYYKERKRDLEKTGIIKIGVANFGIETNGEVPGSPLNQFALDEYVGYLRIAVTVGGNRGFMFGMADSESANDVYVLDSNLKITGAIKDMGLTERIYSARFIGDRGYVVTFRQTDPFYVLDLSSPKNPELKGELKIPGYSSYLHPIANDRILGVGQEDWRVKISLFDVSSAEKPVEKDKYILSESWSEVSSNYHAFLQDAKHGIFFLPGGNGGYIFSYKNDKLELVKAVSGITAKRAIYLNDYLYIIGSDKIIVLNELDWQKVNELKLAEESPYKIPPIPMPLPMPLPMPSL